MSSVRQPMISVIVPTYRRWEAVLNTLDDLLAQRYPSFEVVVADQNSEWPAELQSRKTQIEADSRVRWLSLSAPGVVFARNRAVASSNGEILLFVDDDVAIPSPWLLLAHARNYVDTRVLAVVGRELAPGHGETVSIEPPASPGVPLKAPRVWSNLQQAMWFNRSGRTRQYVCTFCTCNGSVRRGAFVAAGGFDEAYTGNSYGDDYDFALRTWTAESNIVFDPDAWLLHLRSPMGGLRLTDRGNRPDWTATAAGLWLFLLRHGHRGMYGHLLWTHVIRKTVVTRQNLARPWRQVRAALQVLRALPRARSSARRGPVSVFTTGAGR